MSLMPSKTDTEGTLGREEQLDQWAGHTQSGPVSYGEVLTP